MKNLSFDNELLNTEWKIEPKRFLLYLLVSIIFAVLQIQQSLHQGQLSLPPSYDDVSYFNDALLRLNIFYDQGFRGLISNYVVNPPHSFMSTFLAFTGFTIFGVQDWAPSLMNSIIIFTVLIFLDYSTRGLKLQWKIIIVLISLTWPLMGHAVIEFRPDIFCGLLTNIAIILINEKSWINISDNRQITIGFIFGLALITKPSIFPLTLVVVLLELFLKILCEKRLLGKFSYYDAILNSKAFLLTTILTVSLYYPFGIFRTVKYIIKTESSHIWMNPLPFFDSLGYYIFGQGGMMMTKSWLYLCFFLLFSALYIAIIKKTIIRVIVKLFPLLTAIVFSFIVITISDHKTPFIGVIVPCFFFLSSINLMSFIIQNAGYLTHRRGLILFYGILATGISLFMFEWPAPNDLVAPNPNTMSERQYYNNLIPRIYQDLMNEADRERMRANGKPLILYLSSMAHWLHSDSIKYYQYKLKQDGILTNDGVLSDNLAQKIHDIEQSDFILTFSTPSADTPDWLPSVRIEPKVIDFLNHSPNFKLLKTYTNPYTQAKVYLYKNKTL